MVVRLDKEREMLMRTVMVIVTMMVIVIDLVSDGDGAQVGQREGDRLPSHCVSSSWPGRGETWVRFVPHKSLFPIFNSSRNPCLMI